MIRVLQCVNHMHRAGLETMLMNYYRNIDRTKIQFDFLTHRPERADYDGEIEALGGRIYRAPRLYPQNYPAYFSYMQRLFRAHPEYRIVHAHIDAMSYLPLLAAKGAGVPVRIAHSHNTSIDRDLKYPLKCWFKARLPEVATDFLACGGEAGEFLFGGRPFQGLPNAIDMAKFRFDPAVSCQKRKELNADGCFVVGHVGRLSHQKNHEFLLQVFHEVTRRKKNAVLLLIGTGQLEARLRTLAGKLGIENRVRFLGNRGDVSELYQAMDVFLLPSLFEGVPLVGIEAQAAGLSCIFSDKVPKEVAFTESCAFLPLSRSPSVWAEAVFAAGADRTRPLPKSPYDIKTASRILEDYYEAKGEHRCSHL